MNALNSVLYYLICVYIIILPLIPYKTKVMGFPISTDIILALIFIVYGVKVVLSKDSRNRFVVGIKDFFKDYLSISMSILAILMLISVSYALEKKLALTESIRFITYLMLYFIIKYESNYKKYIDGMIKAYICSCTFISLFGILQYFTGIGLNEKFMNYEYAKVKVAATMDNPNNLGAFLILAIFPIIMLAIYEKRKKQKLFYSLLSILLFANIVFTGSRNALLGLIIGIVILAFLYNFKLLILLGFLGGLSLFIPQIQDRLMALTSNTQNQSRIYLWEIAKKMIEDHPILGVGNGNYVSNYDEYVRRYPDFAFYGFTRYPCHNSYLKVESELGIAGGISFISILIIAFIKVKQFISFTKVDFYKYFYTGFLASMAAFYFMNLSDNLFFVPKTASYFWILLAISQGIMFREKKANENQFN